MAYIGTSPSNGVRQTYDYTATAGQTSFSGSDNNSQTLRYADSAYIDVYQNGILLVPSDYTATTGTTVVLDTGATVSDTLQIVVYDVFAVADTVSAKDGGTFTGAVTFTGGVVGVDAFASGTSMLFQQTAAPTGWTKQTTHNDKSLRLVSGSVGTGGSVAFSTAMATPTSNLAVGAGNLAVSMSGNIANTSLSTAQLASHNHTRVPAATAANTGSYKIRADQRSNNNTGTSNNGPINSTGSGQAHNHSHNLSGSMSGEPALSGSVAINVQYVDFIIANKD